ncbi:MAG: hypothetical protein M1816_005459 [Peltula sp. TS41687]|nr:MAG: hypothetical protein M1816_005459 [Peltula sp. TS41687]
MNKLEGFKNLVIGGVDATVDFVKDAFWLLRPPAAAAAAQRPTRLVNGQQQQQQQSHYQESTSNNIIAKRAAQDRVLSGRIAKRKTHDEAGSRKRLKRPPAPRRHEAHTNEQQQQQEKEKTLSFDPQQCIDRESSVMSIKSEPDSVTHGTGSGSSTIVDFTEVEDNNNDGDAWEVGDDDKGEDTVVEPIETVEQMQVALDRHMNWIHDEGKQRYVQTLHEPKDGWSREELVLYQWISVHAFLPLLPLDWKLDFPTLPADWFARHINRTKINSRSGREFAATNALSNLIFAGARVRTNMVSKIDPTIRLKRTINDYIKWAARDGGYDKKIHVPLITIATPNPTELKTLTDRALGRAMEAKIQRRLAKLAQRHRDFLDRQAQRTQLIHPVLPTLYGIVITYAVVLLVSYNAGGSGGIGGTGGMTDTDRPAVVVAPRTLAVLSYKEYEHDVWNGVAIGMLVCRARDWLIRLDKDVGGFEFDEDLLAREAEEDKIDL